MNQTTSPRADIYQTITDHIIAAIEAGAGDWCMPWHVQGNGAAVMPVNAASKKAYRGVNVLNLWIAAQAAGYPAGIWATYKQWAELGAQVRKGEKATLVVFWKVFENGEEEDDAGEDENTDTGRQGRRFMARGYHVFNCAQVDGFDAPALPQSTEPERIATAEAFFAAAGADIRHGGNRAFYAPGPDFIQLPPFAAFRDAVAYYATLAHEATHWTGHPTRCARDFKGRFGSEAYAAEELVAELGAAFLCADLGLASEPRPDHAAYVANWLKVLKGDKRAIFTAASKAQQAADWMHARQLAEKHERRVAA
ncbi:zincin-like metallopeptidase domain-containing protein [Telmatospirillum sp.]|uniref:ArdC family protein n=1 Tax=Telmatospirillum sp. TaxID=2079197 RepID=UPI00283FE3C3|nr:zincin-like metallopeptidase domain-containing protein [Telmatospirillum sp.]MDR3440600.1 zincin-like metallopeptidase domain-containing protein [Telmatospirillum sp.]